MKKILICFLIVFVLFGYIVVSAEGKEDELNLVEITDQTKIEKIVESLSMRVESEKPLDSTLYGFDVNEHGMIAIVHRPYIFDHRDHISILSSDGEFQKAFSFKNSSHCAVRWDGSYLQIFLVMQKLVITVDLEGNILTIYDANGIDNSEWGDYTLDMLETNEKTIDGVTYIASRDYGVFDSLILKSQYTRVTVVSENSENLIYDVNSLSCATMIITVILVIAFFVGVAIKAYSLINKK